MLLGTTTEKRENQEKPITHAILYTICVPVSASYCSALISDIRSLVQYLRYLANRQSSQFAVTGILSGFRVNPSLARSYGRMVLILVRSWHLTDYRAQNHSIIAREGTLRLLIRIYQYILEYVRDAGQTQPF